MPKGRPRNYIQLATQKYLKILFEIADEMKKHGIPVRDHLIKEFGLKKISYTTGLCKRKINDFGEDEFYIYINKRAAQYDTEYALKHVKNTIYHELLHTIVGCCEHNSDFVMFAKICDETFGTHTLRCMEGETYYDENHKPGSHYICPICGMEYIYDDDGEFECECQICGKSMRKIA